ncbi:MAG: hypothetical protein CMI55_02825 [Parcubacteria group bacterium]|jgi:hypothetical protein|nr:hypothetical protein [Parcubacteria group bacterium]|tara:strand:+ start:738 stop:1862 length:1125 start_codon:yes stop_codon:yes gene_type:complete
MPLKKFLIILIIALILIVSSFLIYNSFLKPSSFDTSDDIETTNGDQLTSGSSNIKIISQEAILSPIIDGQKIKYYSATNGNVFESSFDGLEMNQVSSNILNNLSKILWSPNKDKIIAIFEENNQLKKYFYDYATGLSTPLDENIQWIAWSPEQDKIAYQYYNPQTEINNISTADPSVSQWNNILDTRMKNLIVEWPSKTRVSIRTRASGLAQSVVYTIDLENNNLKKIVNETYGLTVLWSPLGDKLLFSETNKDGKNLKLKIADLAKQTIDQLDFITLPEKCVWSQDNQTIFCAVPTKEIRSMTVLPDDYYKDKIYFSDAIWRINLDTGEATQVAGSTTSNEATYDAKELLLSPLEDYLFFINRKNDYLYNLKL